MKLRLASFTLAVGLTANLCAQTIANYQATVASQNPSNWFKLDGTLASAVNPGVVLTSFAGGYGPDAYRTDSNCWSFTDQNTAFLKDLSDPIISGGGTS